ncbi:histone-lysine N-methyltransferase SETMAR [Trichonephila clavipes]|nr:histone-lysine N-methyltransferase SETMAR [Trichonephila clavipes]
MKTPVPTRQENKKWVFEDDPTTTMGKRQRAMKKVIYAVFLRSTALVKAIKLEGEKTVTANWYTPKCLPKIPQEVNVRGLMLHHDNASCHTAGLTAEVFEKKIKVIEHPPYSPDLAMCDFWLSFNL